MKRRRKRVSLAEWRRRGKGNELYRLLRKKFRGKKERRQACLSIAGEEQKKKREKSFSHRALRREKLDVFPHGEGGLREGPLEEKGGSFFRAQKKGHAHKELVRKEGGRKTPHQQFLQAQRE